MVDMSVDELVEYIKGLKKVMVIKSFMIYGNSKGLTYEEFLKFFREHSNYEVHTTIDSSIVLWPPGEWQKDIGRVVVPSG